MAQKYLYSSRQLILGKRFSPPFETVGLQGTSLASHKLITGTTGQGKSRFIAALVVQLLNTGVATAVIDPHGDLVRAILTILLDTGFYNHPQAFKRVWYIDFGRDDAFLPFNVLQAGSSSAPHVIAANVLEAFKRAWPSLAGGNAANFENILLSAAFVLSEQGEPLTAISRLLADPLYREQLLQKTSDPLIRDFFTYRFASYGRQAAALSESTLRRVFLLTFSPALRYSLGQKENRLHFRSLMDHGVTCLFNLSGLDAQTQRLLGSLLTVGFESASLSRSDIAEQKRTAYHLFIDEFAQFCSQSEDTLERMLTLTRKFGLSLTLSSQVVSQIKHLYPALQNALHISFQMGDVDAPLIAGKFADIDALQLQNSGADLFLDRPQSFEPAGKRALVVNDAKARLAFSKLIQSLEPREALIRLNHETVRFRTLTVPSRPLLEGQLEQIEREYARQLLTPASTLDQATRSDDDISQKPTLLPSYPQAAKNLKTVPDEESLEPDANIDFPTPSRRWRELPGDEEWEEE